MVQIIKTAVKCYKKRAKKTVGGKQKVYEYNQYLIPLKRSDNLECKEGVLIIPEKYFKDLFGVEDTWAVKEYLSKLKGYEMSIEGYQKDFKELELQYQKEFKDLEWKHSELSRSYKALLSKHTKATKLYKMDSTKLPELEAKIGEMAKQLESKDIEYRKLKEDYELAVNKGIALEEELKQDENRSGEDKDFWSMLKNRLGKKELASKDE
jgi:DNA repair ATPase RecN